MTRTPILRRVLALCALAAVAGCTTTTKTEPNRPPPVRVTGKQMPLPADLPRTPETAVQGDPCAARLHDLAGGILMYYALNRRVPATLAEVQSLADVEELTCPVSSQPYVYTPNGLYSPDGKWVVLAHDPVASHRGTRHCILTPADGPRGANLNLEVLPVPEALFRAYTPPAPAAP